MPTRSVHRALYVWAPRVLVISLVFALVTFVLAPISKLFIVLAIVLGIVDSISSMEELTGGKELKWISIPVIIIGDIVAKAASFESTARVETWALYIQFVSMVVFAESLVIVLLRTRLEAFCLQRRRRKTDGDVQNVVASHKKAGVFVIFGLVAVSHVACAAAIQAPTEPMQVAVIAMEPSLKKGDRILVTKDVGELKRGDVVIYHFPFDESQSFISRIIGLPNEEIEIRGGRILVDGRYLEESYLNPDFNRSPLDLGPVKTPEGSYFVMGDNRDNSNDSRIWGALQKKFIYRRFIKKY